MIFQSVNDIPECIDDSDCPGDEVYVDNECQSECLLFADIHCLDFADGHWDDDMPVADENFDYLIANFEGRAGADSAYQDMDNIFVSDCLL